MVDRVVFITLFGPILTNIGDTFILNVLNLWFLCVDSVFFWVVLDDRQWLELSLLFRLVLSDDSGCQFCLICFLREDSGSSLRVGSYGGCVEESLCKCIFVVGLGRHFGRLCDLVAGQGALHIIIIWIGGYKLDNYLLVCIIYLMKINNIRIIRIILNLKIYYK